MTNLSQCLPFREGDIVKFTPQLGRFDSGPGKDARGPGSGQLLKFGGVWKHRDQFHLLESYKNLTPEHFPVCLVDNYLACLDELELVYSN